MFWGEKPVEELYDMAADPDSVHNLAADPAQRATLDRMRAELRRRVLLAHDNGFIPEGSPLEGYDGIAPPGAVPMQRLFELAMTASQRDAANLPALIAALDDRNEAVRWWAAQGCAMLGAERRRRSGASQAARRPVGCRPGRRRRIVDPLGPCGHRPSRSPARTGRSGFYALHAANVLYRAGAAARPLLPAMKRRLAETADAPTNSAPFYVNRILVHCRSRAGGP